MFEKVENDVYNNYTHDALSHFTKEYKDGRMTLPEYLQASTNLLDKTYNKNAVYKQIKSGRVFRR